MTGSSVNTTGTMDVRVFFPKTNTNEVLEPHNSTVDIKTLQRC